MYHKLRGFAARCLRLRHVVCTSFAARCLRLTPRGRLVTTTIASWKTTRRSADN